MLIPSFIIKSAASIVICGILPSTLRSRIVGNGYEVLMENSIPDTKENRMKYLQFIAQEINVDGKIPHMVIDAADLIINEGRRRALEEHKSNALTLKLRELGGLIRASGDMSIENGHKLIEKSDVKEALSLYVPVEEKNKEVLRQHE